MRDGERPAVRLAAGRGESPVGVGRDRAGQAGRRVPALRRDAAISSRTRPPPSARASSIRGFAGATDLAVGKGRVFWADGQAGALAAAAPAGRCAARPSSRTWNQPKLDSDGDDARRHRRPARRVLGGATGVSITRPGSGKARLRAERQYSEEYAGFRVPVVTAKGVTTLFDHFTFTTSTTFADLAAGEPRLGRARDRRHADPDLGRRRRQRRLRRGAFGRRLRPRQRLPRADHRPRAVPDRARRPRARAASCRRGSRSTSASRPSLRTKVRGSKITGRTPLAGVAVEVRDSDEKLVASLARRRGKVDAAEADGDGRRLPRRPAQYAYDGRARLSARRHEAR